jgi:hypothetical protein
VSVVLPASGWEMMAKVRRLAISAASEFMTGPVFSRAAARKQTPG